MHLAAGGSTGLATFFADDAMPIELHHHLINHGTALVLHAETQLEDADLAQILGFTEPQRRALTVVVLSHTQVTGACLEYLACLPHLRELYLNDTQISDQDPLDLSGWRLETVNLDNTRLGDLGIAGLARAPNLRTVRLCNTQVTDRGVLMLATLPKLREYYLDGAPISNHAKRRLDNAIKMAHIDLAGAFRLVGREIALGARLLVQLFVVPGPVGWVRGWML